MKLATLLFAVLVLGCFSARSQVYLLNGAKLVDRSTRHSFVVTPPANLSSTIRLVFPTVAGAAGQALYITSITGNEVTLGWATTSDATSSANTDRVVNQESTTPPTLPAGLSVSLLANTAYRYQGALRVNRDNAGGSPSDNFRLKLTVPANTTFYSLGIRCVTCASTPTGLPTYSSATTGTTITSANIDPSDFTAQNYVVEGVVVTGSTADSMTLTVERDVTATSTNNIVLEKQSNIVVREVK